MRAERKVELVQDISQNLLAHGIEDERLAEAIARDWVKRVRTTRP